MLEERTTDGMASERGGCFEAGYVTWEVGCDGNSPVNVDISFLCIPCSDGDDGGLFCD